MNLPISKTAALATIATLLLGLPALSGAAGHGGPDDGCPLHQEPVAATSTHLAQDAEVRQQALFGGPLTVQNSTDQEAPQYAPPVYEDAADGDHATPLNLTREANDVRVPKLLFTEQANEWQQLSPPVRDIHLTNLLHYQVRTVSSGQADDEAWVGLTFTRHFQSK